MAQVGKERLCSYSVVCTFGNQSFPGAFSSANLLFLDSDYLIWLEILNRGVVLVWVVFKVYLAGKWDESANFGSSYASGV